jgi:hypothetical protein
MKEKGTGGAERRREEGLLLRVLMREEKSRKDEQRRTMTNDVTKSSMRQRKTYESRKPLKEIALLSDAEKAEKYCVSVYTLLPPPTRRSSGMLLSSQLHYNTPSMSPHTLMNDGRCGVSK